jgi:recombination protein RecR
MNSIDKLAEIFSHFPGIGPRQAKRFVYYLLTRNSGAIDELIRNISELKNDMAVCSDCGRFYQRKNTATKVCDICSDENRDHSLLMIVPRDSDLESVEKHSDWEGTYFVLGGTIPILEKEPEKRIRIQELKAKMEKSKDKLKEIILAMNFNPEGENTTEYVKKVLENIIKDQNIKISTLGKGLSMGTELEYADTETMKNALKNRS